MNGLRLLRALRRLSTRRGLVFTERPGKGSHVVVTLNGAMSVIPQHRDPLKPGTLRAILKQLRLAAADLED